MNTDLLDTQPIIVIPERPALPKQICVRRVRRVHMRVSALVWSLFGAALGGGLALFIGFCALVVVLT
jgi:hypothetical protein